jgi:hypothetical protein
MPQFTVTLSRLVAEYAEVIIEAETDAEAERYAETHAAEYDKQAIWSGNDRTDLPAPMAINVEAKA